jgi:surface antigen
MRVRLRRFLAAVLLSVAGFLLSPSAKALQCVPFAREQSGIGLRGDAWTWWTAAAGQYDRGQAPRQGAVVVFKKHGKMSHGHVAVVAHVLTNRRVLVDHANWAPNRGRQRGRVSKLVVVSDVSPKNDWSQVRVWNDASGELGTRIYPTYGFIYPRADVTGQLIAEAEDGDAAPLQTVAGDSLPGGDQPAAAAGDLSATGAIASLTDLLTPPLDSGSYAIAPGLAQ